ncbi:MAG TPA: hypothetical protein DCY93_02310 [Firmicutes bacterium]|nr:hypothetical protein [Bacillota bacterium]
MKKQRTKNTNHTMKKLVKMAKPMLPQLIVVAIMVVLSSIFQIVGPVLFQDLTSAETMAKILVADPVTFIIHVNSTLLLKTVGIIALVYFLMSFFAFVGEFMVSKITGKLTYRLRNDVKIKLDSLPLEFFDNNSNGDIISRVSNDIDLITTAIQQIVTQIIKAVCLLIGTSIAMLVTSWQCGLVAIATFPLCVLLALFISKFSQPLFIKQQALLGKVNGKVEEAYAGFKVIKLFNKEKDFQKDFDYASISLSQAGYKAFSIAGLMLPVMTFIHNLAYVIICVVAGFLGDASMIVAFFMFLNIYQQPIQQIAQLASNLQQTDAATRRVFAILDAKDEPEDKENAVIATKDIKGKVEFNNVSFSYNPDVPLIEDLSLKVSPGDSIAIVGPTGAGKTTLVNLIMRFYEINGGSLKIDGVEISDYTRDSIREQIGMVLQDTWLFNGTIADNIAYGNINATREEIIEAAKEAHAHHFIMTLPDGYDTVLNEEGTNVSQGQKQLLTIARAILSNPRILILDEATSSVDTRTEKLLQDAMTNMMKNRTTFVIAHRLSTIKNAKMILVMNKGHIIEKGNHQELLEAKGFYADLYNAQFLGNSEGVDESQTNS